MFIMYTDVYITNESEVYLGLTFIKRLPLVGVEGIEPSLYGVEVTPKITASSVPPHAL